MRNARGLKSASPRATAELVGTSALAVLAAVVFVLNPRPAAAATAGWSLVWADEFDAADGSAPDTSKWVFDLGGGGWGNNELETYTSRRENSRIEGGKLVLEARKETFTGADGLTRNYTSARLKTLGKAWWALGRIEARVKVPEGKGLWPAFWMLGTNFPSAGWPTCGEIDIMEYLGREPTKVYGTIHGPGYSGAGGIGSSTNLSPQKVADDFHLFAVEWEANRIRWFLDNQPYFTVTPASLPSGASWAFNQPQFILLNLAVGGNWPGSPDASTAFPQRMEVDYVRVYKRTNTTAALLQIRAAGSQVEIAWPGEFPHWRLLSQGSFGQAWRDVPLIGTRRDDWFYQAAQPGFYRLAYLP